MSRYSPEGFDCITTRADRICQGQVPASSQECMCPSISLNAESGSALKSPDVSLSTPFPELGEMVPRTRRH